HAIVGQECGYPRVYLGVGDDPLAVSDDAIVEVVKRRRDLIVTNGPWLTVSKDGKSLVGAQIALGSKDSFEVTVEVHAADWVSTNRLEVWKSGRLAETHAIAAGTQAERLRIGIRLTA